MSSARDLVRGLCDDGPDPSAPQRVPDLAVEYALSASIRSGRVRGRPPLSRSMLTASKTAVNARLSCRCPADVTREIGRHHMSAARRILVVSPPRLCPKHSRSTGSSPRPPESLSFDTAP